MIRWNLTGTEAQQAIAREAFNRSYFPWERLTLLPGTPELGWRDLNGSALAAELDHARAHDEHSHDDIPHAIEEIDEQGRRYTLGVIYTRSLRIYIEQSLVTRPMAAMTTIMAEGGHAVDIGLPMTDAQRNEFLRRWGVGGTWWEVSDYGSEYRRLGGEGFMKEFVVTYCPTLDGNSISGFMHDSGVEPADVIEILEIQRTDYVPPAPPVVVPVPPEPPEARPSQFIHFPGGKDIFHKPAHYPGRGVPLETLDGFRECKVCKP